MNETTDDESAIRELVSTWMRAAASQGQTDVKFEGANDILEIKVLGDWAFLRSHITLTIGTSEGQSNRRSGYTLTIPRKLQSGKWVLFRDVDPSLLVYDACFTQG